MSPSPIDFRGCFDLIRVSCNLCTSTVSCPASISLDLSLFDKRLDHIVEDHTGVELYEEDTITVQLF
jgi:hypothetical protein